MNNEELYRDFMSRFDAKNPPKMRDAFVAGMEVVAKTERCNAVSLMHYLDEHSAEGKMCLSNMECADLESAFQNNDWAKVIRYITKYLCKIENHEKKTYSEKELNELVGKYTDSINGNLFFIDEYSNAVCSCEEIDKAFKAGFCKCEELQPRWHDLRKDPNDLPPIDEDYGYSNTTLVASYYGKVFSAYYDVESETWWGGGDTDYRKNEIAAWMPLPEWKGGER